MSASKLKKKLNLNIRRVPEQLDRYQELHGNRKEVCLYVIPGSQKALENGEEIALGQLKRSEIQMQSVDHVRI